METGEEELIGEDGGRGEWRAWRAVAVRAGRRAGRERAWLMEVQQGRDIHGGVRSSKEAGLDVG